jgi:hypothetical protein
MAAFWVTAAVATGGVTHRQTGRWFSQSIYAAAATGFPLAVFGPLAASTPHLTWLVLYLLVVVITPVQHGLAVIAAGPSPMRVRSRLHAVLNLAAMGGSLLLFPASIVWQSLWFLLVVPAGFVVALRNMRYASRTAASPADWQREHLTSLLTAGIAMHTAFFVLTATRWPEMFGHGLWRWAAWLLPTLVGLPVIALVRRRNLSYVGRTEL